jgi:hypothetical protein
MLASIGERIGHYRRGGFTYPSRIYKGIQVKALSKRYPVPLGNTLDKFMGDWWIIVTNAGTTSPVCFIMKPEEVKQLAHRGEKEGRVSYWLQPNQYDTDKFREAWGRIGRGDRTA